MLSPALLTLVDDSQVEETDRFFNWFYKPNQVGKRRSEALANELNNMNTNVKIDVVDGSLIPESLIKKYNIFILTDCYSIQLVEGYDQLCRTNNVAFIIANCIGTLGSIFVDFGENHRIEDKYHSSRKQQYFVKHITNERPGKVELHNLGKASGFQTGDYVCFSGVEGMSQVNGNEPRPIKVIDENSFTIEPTLSFDKYAGGGVVTYEKVPTKLAFKSFKQAWTAGKMKSEVNSNNTLTQLEYHICMMIYYELREEHEVSVSLLVDTLSDKNFDEVFEEIIITRPLIKNLYDRTAKRKQLIYKLMTHLLYARGQQLVPVSMIIANYVSIQLICLTGKLTPIHQFAYFDASDSLSDDFIGCLGYEEKDLLSYHFESHKLTKPGIIDFENQK